MQHVFPRATSQGVKEIKDKHGDDKEAICDAAAGNSSSSSSAAKALPPPPPSGAPVIKDAVEPGAIADKEQKPAAVVEVLTPDPKRARIDLDVLSPPPPPPAGTGALQCAPPKE